MTIGKLRRVPLREVWKHEAADFSVDLVGEDESGRLLRMPEGT